jgi:hypothetical protein
MSALTHLEQSVLHAYLEGTTTGCEPWPADVAGFTLHLGDPERDLSDLGPPD